MITAITVFTSQRNPETGKRERFIVLPETVEYYDTERLIVTFYLKADDKFVTVPGYEFEQAQSEWLAQFEVK